MLEKQCVQGRWIDAGDVQWLRGWIESNMQWSRKRIARELCLKWDWKDQRGRIKDFAARSFLLKLEGRGEICLPPPYERRFAEFVVNQANPKGGRNPQCGKPRSKSCVRFRSK